jgi:hypothetical protein
MRDVKGFGYRKFCNVMPVRTVCALLFVAACVSFYFGSGWLFMLPTFPGEHYFSRERMVPGLGFSALGIVLVIIAGWMWARISGTLSLGTAIGNCFSFAGAAVILFWMSLIIIGAVRQAIGY